ncbi:hypothetical protein [Paraburkholderia dinghuensis]|uniref:Uncharacterized protein n=1 Tax=Paraburkholderia dinghuensis TaxID=2305225 RepID=A0A3N6PMC3_9BURK|nr:hypothetical protein [Paraburkholderia dinghuensis]RQH02740.1 hypothetical protein D1Y85_21645 [Paraburkholderia dinghuensis]
MEKRYHVVVVIERTGEVVRLSARPITHEEGCTWLGKIADYPWRRKQLEEVTPHENHTDFST